MAEAAAADKPDNRVNPIWLLPSAMSFVGYCQDVFEFGGSVARLCRGWLQFCREFWDRVLGFAGASVNDATADLLTLWVTSSLAIWILPFVTPRGDGRVQTTVGAFETLGLPAWLSRALGFVLIALAIPVIAAPFGAFPQAVGGSELVDTLRESQIVGGGDAGFGAWLSGEGVWLAGVFVVIGGALLCYDFFVLGPPLARARLSAAERRDLVLIAIVLWLVSAALLALAVAMPIDRTWAGLAKQDAMVLSLLALVGLVAWRSALPFVQLASLAVVIFAIDAFVQFVSQIWAASGGAG